MNTIKSNAKKEIEINKSRFIALLIKVNSIEDVNETIISVKKEYKDATHYCYAYIIDDIRKSSDDNEPSGTAGIPIMEVLLKKDLNHILCIVVRYFGGIKLGSGGLIRAYSNITNKAINNAEIVKLIDGYYITITSLYNEQKVIEQLLKNYKFEKIYTQAVTYTASVPCEVLKELETRNINYQIQKTQKIEIK